MSSGKFNSVNFIEADRVQAQLEKLCKHPLFDKSDQLKKLLNFFVRRVLDNEVDEVGQKDVLLRVFKGSKVDESRVGHLLKDLRSNLVLYYSKDGADDDILIACPEPESAYKVIIRSKSFRPVDCYELGDELNGLQYEISHMKHLSRLRDVHTRLNLGHWEFDDKPLDNYEEAVREFLSHPKHKNKYELIIGRVVEPGYLDRIIRAATAAITDAEPKDRKKREKQIECRRLVHAGSLMNFDILEYRDGRPTEVLFGWGRYGNWSKGEKVFRTDDQRLVAEFERFYEVLTGLSTKVELEDLSEAAESAIINPAWSQDQLYQLLKSAKKGTEVRILTTLFIDWAATFSSVEKILKRGINVKIVMMNHKNAALIKARFGRRKDFPPTKAARAIREQFATFKQTIADNKFPGTLEVRQSDLMPFGFFVQSGEAILVGLMPPLSSYLEGPMIEVETNSPLGISLQENWEAYWKSSESSKRTLNQAPSRARKRAP